MKQMDDLLSQAEQELKNRFSKDVADRSRVQSTADAAPGSERLDALVLPDEMRPKMPFTMDKFIIKENPHLVQWEREVRKFIRNLSPLHSHRLSAVMVYEWATGIKLADAMNSSQTFSSGKQNWRTDLRKINKILEFYFGKPYMTYIMGRKVPRAYRMRQGYYIRRHRPMTLTLYAEYVEGTLYP